MSRIVAQRVTDGMVLSTANLYFTAHDNVWLATADEIADWYLTQHYDTALTALQAARRRR